MTPLKQFQIISKEITKTQDYLESINNYPALQKVYADLFILHGFQLKKLNNNRDSKECKRLLAKCEILWYRYKGYLTNL